jgi:hypothetical protein
MSVLSLTHFSAPRYPHVRPRAPTAVESLSAMRHPLVRAQGPPPSPPPSLKCADHRRAPLLRSPTHPHVPIHVKHTIASFAICYCHLSTSLPDSVVKAAGVGAAAAAAIDHPTSVSVTSGCFPLILSRLTFPYTSLFCGCQLPPPPSIGASPPHRNAIAPNRLCRLVDHPPFR